MFVIENVVLTEAVVTGAAGTIPEFQLRMICVCAAADITFMPVSPLCFLFFLLTNSRFELNRLRRVLMPDLKAEFAQQVCDPVPEENGVREPDSQQHRQQI